jgi:lysozyme
MPFSWLDDFDPALPSLPAVAGSAGDDPEGFFNLSGSVGDLGDNNRSDVIKTQIMLGETGHFDLGGLGGPTGWPSSDLSRGLRRYQQDRGLTVDGIMLPGGETLRSLGDDLAEMKNYRAPSPDEVDRQHRQLAQAQAGIQDDAGPTRSAAAGFSLSARGLDAIKQHEKFEQQVYSDQAGKHTIGYGHKLLPGEKAKYPGTIDEKTAADLLAKDVATAEAAVQRLVKAPLTQQEYDALVSLAYNIGAGEKGFAGSTALRKLNEGDYRAAADAMLMWDKITQNGQKVQSKGLVNRRNDERNLFLNGTYQSGVTRR